MLFPKGVEVELPKTPVSRKTTQIRRKWKAVKAAKKDRQRLDNEIRAPLQGTPSPMKRIL